MVLLEEGPGAMEPMSFYPTQAPAQRGLNTLRRSPALLP
ncbi:hypothetical protein STIAU_4558 [Stigmatella aurantiaca DW4/3-1]|uniref:Uncharacterized protein n=1 Tax=Stigmatella aurantiaca (strain DW4/3-1) TaxID=378806 RepID=Q08Q58_STIAD|nr:hypothetical protein STIAU_4558 [Stigmatella aurantiaca DW4/3-1]